MALRGWVVMLLTVVSGRRAVVDRFFEVTNSAIRVFNGAGAFTHLNGNDISAAFNHLGVAVEPVVRAISLVNQGVIFVDEQRVPVFATDDFMVFKAGQERAGAFNDVGFVLIRLFDNRHLGAGAGVVDRFGLERLVDLLGFGAGCRPEQEEKEKDNAFHGEKCLVNNVTSGGRCKMQTKNALPCRLIVASPKNIERLPACAGQIRPPRNPFSAP